MSEFLSKTQDIGGHLFPWNCNRFYVKHNKTREKRISLKIESGRDVLYLDFLGQYPDSSLQTGTTLCRYPRVNICIEVHRHMDL